MALDNVTITVCDADTFYHPQYFAALSHHFLRTPTTHRQRRIWQPVMCFMPNVLKVPLLCTVRYTQFSLGFAGQMYNPLGLPMPCAVYSLGAKHRHSYPGDSVLRSISQAVAEQPVATIPCLACSTGLQCNQTSSIQQDCV
eukprot:SAG25_NODE_1609_length_2687_cov_1.034003_3_plen_141_part_00